MDTGIARTAPAGVERAEQGGRPLAGWVALGILVSLLVFVSIDRSVLPLQAERIRLDLGLSDAQLGLLQDTGGAVFTALAAYPIAWLADRFGRPLVTACCVVLWSAALAACALSQGFVSLLVAVSFLAAGGAGLLPISMAMVADLFTGRRLQIANAVFIFLVGVGGALALVVVGHLVDAVEAVRAGLPEPLDSMVPWRLMFLAVALPAPGLLVLLGVLAALGTGGRAGPASSGGPATANPPLFAFLRARPGIILGVYGAIGLFSFGQAAIGTWIFVICFRLFGQGAAQVGSMLGTISLFAAPIGLGCSLALTRLFGPRLGPMLPIRLLRLGLALVAVFVAAMGFARSAEQLYALFFLSNTVIATIGMSSPGLFQSLGPAPIRSRLFAILTISNTGFAAAAGPFVGLLSDRAQGLEFGLLIVTAAVAAPAFLLAAALLWLSEGRYRAIVAVPAESREAA